MKKILCLIVSLFICLLPVSVSAETELPEVTDHEVVTIYLFFQDTCTHCHDFIEYFSEIYLDYSDYFEIKTFQVNAYEDDYYLYEAVSEALGEEPGGVPLIVVGETYYKYGFGSDGTEIIEAALEAYQDDDYNDLVQDVIEDTDSDATAKSFLSACSAAGITCAGEDTTTESSGLSDGVVIGIIFGVVILGFGALVIFSRKD